VLVAAAAAAGDGDEIFLGLALGLDARFDTLLLPLVSGEWSSKLPLLLPFTLGLALSSLAGGVPDLFTLRGGFPPLLGVEVLLPIFFRVVIGEFEVGAAALFGLFPPVFAAFVATKCRRLVSNFSIAVFQCSRSMTLDSRTKMPYLYWHSKNVVPSFRPSESPLPSRNRTPTHAVPNNIEEEEEED